MPGIDDLKLAVVAAVALSILARGVTASPFARLFGRAMAHGEPSAKHRHVPHFSLRFGRR